MARLTIGPVCMSYAYLMTPRPAMTAGQRPKYGAQLLIPKTATETYKKIQDAIQQTKADYIAKKGKAAWLSNARTTLYDGDGYRPGGESFGAEAKGCWVLSTSTQKQPIIVDAQKQPILDENEVYSGMIGLAVINFYVYDTSGNKGLACSLDGVMKTADGQRLSGYTVNENDWNNVAAKDLADAFNAFLE